jgi:chemotaxis signal transduction protein
MAEPIPPRNDSPAPAANAVVRQEVALDSYLGTLLAHVPEFVETAAETPAAVPAEAETHDGTPAWAQSEFQTLFFKVHGIVLAAPLMAVRRVEDFSAPPRSLPESPSWLLGLVDAEGGTVGILHTAELLLGRERLGGRDFGTQPYGHILHSRQGRYAFACDEVLDMGKLHPTDVAWRSPASLGRRPWLIGMVPGRLCALVDLERLVPLLRGRAAHTTST